jgi:hypothetical protein
VRAINSAQSTYAASCASGNYAQSLDDLAKPPANTTSAFISPDLKTNGVLKSGYLVNVGPGAVVAPAVLAANTCNVSAVDALPSYFADAHPTVVGSTGQRSFGTDQRGTIFGNNLGAAFTAATVTASTSPLQ